MFPVSAVFHRLLNMVVTLLNVLLSFIIMELAFAQMEYQNAEGERGTCVMINNCPTVSSLFNSEPLSTLTTEFLRRSKCEYDERNQLLCCVEPATDDFPSADEQPSAGFNLKTHPKANLLPLHSCGQDRKRIWEGSYVKLDEFPWTALLQYRRETESIGFYCGGTLINKRYVLTTANCVVEPLPYGLKLTTVRLGENYLDSDQDCETDIFSGRLQCAPLPQDFGIEEIIEHPKYEPTSRSKEHDIALIRLDRDAKLDTLYVKPICLPTKAEVEIGKELLLAGWGETDTGVGSKFKLKVEVPVVSTEECNRTYSAYFTLGEGQLCAGGVPGRDSCRGDGGMPLMDWTESFHDETVRYSVAGIVSFGRKRCGLKGWPGIYTKVFYYVPWILENIQP